MAETPRPVVVIVGPTASGKSALALRLARRLDGEIVSVDSAQVYRGLDAATDKPPRSAREAVPHHLVDVADPRRDFSAGDFARLAAASVEAVRAAGRVAILAGGTGLYLRALLRGLAEMPRRDEPLRAALALWESRRGGDALHRMLRTLDGTSAERLAPRDRQRLVRAIEVALLSGRPLSAHLAEAPFGEERWPAVKAGLRAPWDVLGARIDARVESFFEAGLVEEVRGLLAAGVPPAANAFKALGYREVLQHLAGARDLASTIALVKANTRRYARRQLTWFRREPGVVWYETGENPDERFDAIEELVALRTKAWGS